MSLAEQIEKLQRLQKKADTYRRMLISLQSEFRKEDENEELNEELLKDFEHFVNQRVEALENFKPLQPEKVAVQPSESAVKKEAAQPAKTKEEELVADIYADVPTDPLRFMQKFKHLANADVMMETPNGPVKGKVTRLNIPNVIVETDTGYVVEASPLDVKAINE